MGTVDGIADQLYRLPPARFTTARDGHVAQARKVGDRTTAATLTSLRRPSVSAWLVNLLALERPQDLAKLIDLGASMRAAQAGATRQQLRDLSGHRRREIDALLAAAIELAGRAGHPAPVKQQLSEVEAALAAAMADPEQARRVQAGRLVKAVSYSGFGELVGGAGGAGPVSPARRAQPAPTGLSRVAPAEDTDQRRVAAQARLAQAQRAEAAAVQAERDATDAERRIAEQIADLRDRLAAAQRGLRTAHHARLAAQREVAAARRRLAAVDRS